MLPAAHMRSSCAQTRWPSPDSYSPGHPTSGTACSSGLPSRFEGGAHCPSGDQERRRNIVSSGALRKGFSDLTSICFARAHSRVKHKDVVKRGFARVTFICFRAEKDVIEESQAVDLCVLCAFCVPDNAPQSRMQETTGALPLAP
eukprot:1575853-Rhodomonas_salina.1